ncbi:hypothetical protein BGZ73_002202 [Actinomortierella ambigua]|nr:hypothetical protein BGZ73_002202 [Actinomortierella ambigua]
MHPSLHPPELAQQIARHLSSADKKACTLVCKSWYANYIPTLWSTLRLPALRTRADTLDASTKARDKAAILRKFIHHVRYLHWPLFQHPPGSIVDQDELYQIVAQECKSQLLEIHASIGCQEHLDMYTALVDENPGLQTLDLHVVLYTQTADDFRLMLTRFAQKAPRLQELSLSCGTLPAAWMAQLLASLPKLQSLTLRRERESSSAVISSWLINPEPTTSINLLRFESLQRLVLEYAIIDEAMVSLLKQCPNLEQLHIGYLGGISASQEALDKLQSSLPRLRSCTLRRPEDTWYSPYFALEPVLKMLPAQSLRELNILSGSIAESLIVQAHDPIDVRHFLLGERNHNYSMLPWACTQLEVLRIPLILDRSHDQTFAQPRLIGNLPLQPDPDNFLIDEFSRGFDNWRQKKTRKGGERWRDWVKAERQLMRRLGDLVQLRELNFSTECCNRGKKMNRVCLTWSLENGLHYLSGLTKLEKLHRGRGRFMQEEPELRWMQAYWPNLREMACAPIPYRTPYQQWFARLMPQLTITILDSTGPHLPYPEPEFSSH